MTFRAHYVAMYICPRVDMCSQKCLQFGFQAYPKEQAGKCCGSNVSHIGKAKPHLMLLNGIEQPHPMLLKLANFYLLFLSLSLSISVYIYI